MQNEEEKKQREEEIRLRLVKRFGYHPVCRQCAHRQECGQPLTMRGYFTSWLTEQDFCKRYSYKKWE